MPPSKGPFQRQRARPARAAVRDAGTPSAPAVEARPAARRQTAQIKLPAPKHEPSFLEKLKMGADTAKLAHEAYRNRNEIKGRIFSRKFWIVAAANILLGYVAFARLVDPELAGQIMAAINAAYLSGQSVVDAVARFRVGSIARDIYTRRDLIKDKFSSRKFWIAGLGSGMIGCLTALGLDHETCAQLIGSLVGIYLIGESGVDAASNTKPKV